MITKRVEFSIKSKYTRVKTKSFDHKEKYEILAYNMNAFKESWKVGRETKGSITTIKQPVRGSKKPSTP